MEQILVISNDSLFNNKLIRLKHKFTFEYDQHMNIHTIHRWLKQYHPKLLLIHPSANINLSLLDYFITHKIIPIIYVNTNINLGQFYNLTNDLFFIVVEISKVEHTLSHTISIMLKVEREYRLLLKKIIKLENKIYDDKLVTAAKRLLMEIKQMSEEEAYKYIQDEAMKSRVSKGIIAKQILEKNDR